MQNTSNIIEHPRASWVEQRLMRRCRVGEPTARVVGELAGIQAGTRSTEDIVQTALARLALIKRGAR